MAISQFRAKRKPSGARYKAFRKEKQYELGSDPTLTKMAKQRRMQLRITGGNIKVRLLSSDVANIYDPKSKKHQVVKIKTVADNPANVNYVRRNILTKGAIIDTELGKARITSRPGQEGTINAILI